MNDKTKALDFCLIERLADAGAVLREPDQDLNSFLFGNNHPKRHDEHN